MLALSLQGTPDTPAAVIAPSQFGSLHLRQRAAAPPFAQPRATETK